MSKFSGACDLYDHISFEKMYDKGSCKVSDELECFEIFKKKTDGVIYQDRKITISEWNQEYVKSNCINFDFTEHFRNVRDKRAKSGIRTERYYTYKYFGKEFNSLKELNKHGVYITVKIPFNTLLDIIPYYGHTVTCSVNNEGKETVYISEENKAIEEYNYSLEHGGCMTYPNYVVKNITENMQEAINKYFNYKLEERTKRIPLILAKPLHNECYEIVLDHPTDYMHPPKFVWKDGKISAHWSGPTISDNERNVILIHARDVEQFLAEDIKNNNVEIEYTETCEFPNEARDDK